MTAKLCDYEKARKQLPPPGEWNSTRMEVLVNCEDGVDRVFLFECRHIDIRELGETIRVQRQKKNLEEELNASG